MDLQKKYITIQDAFAHLQSGQTIVTAMAASEPQAFFHTCHDHLQKKTGITILCANPSKSYPIFTDADFVDKLKIVPMFLTSSIRKYQSVGHIYYIPQHLSHWAKNILNQRQIDIFWGSCSVPDERGFVSLGPSSVYESEILQAAKLIFLECNPNIPNTMGSTYVNLRDVDYLIRSEYSLPTIGSVEPNQIDYQIAEYISTLVHDNSTVQLGIGAIPNAVGSMLKTKRNLGIHTEMINDAIMELALSGAVTGKCKSKWPRKIIGSFAFGSRELYEFLDHNPQVELHPASIVINPYRIGRNHQMISINTALEIDITGQVCSESIGHHELSGVGGAAETHVGAQLSKGGRGIIAMHSMTKCGHSKIVCELMPGAKVSISRNDIDTVVTEFGIAELKGKTVNERAEALIRIAHPDHRQALRESAATNHYLK